MNLSERGEKELRKIISKLSNNTFDEDDISRLLLFFRAEFKDQKLIWEFASFIAHPESRDQGVFHQALDVTYAKFKYIHTSNGSDEPLNIRRIESGLYKAIVLGSLEIFPEKEIKEKLGKSKQQCLQTLKECYKKIDGVYELQSVPKFKEAINIVNLINSYYEFKYAFNPDSLISQFQYCLKKSSQSLSISFDAKTFLKNHRNDIILCLMCLIHSSKFKLFDKTEGHCELHLTRNMEKLKVGEVEWNFNLNAYVKITTKKLQGGSTFSWALLGINSDVSHYLPSIETVDTNILSAKLTSFNAIRNPEGKLIIGDRI
jgi:hypothetical protein